jgi:hypothetical protein
LATPLQNLLTRQQNITNTLAALTTGQAGGGPTYDVNGQMVDHDAYVKRLYDELEQINRQIAVLQGPFEVIDQGMA